MCLGEIAASLQAITVEGKPAAERLRRIFLELARRGENLFFQNRKMHDIVATALAEQWSSCDLHDEALLDVIRKVLNEGRKAGEFERKTPLEEASRAILLAMEPIKNPVLLEQRLDTLEADAAVLANLVLRSLAP